MTRMTSRAARLRQIEELLYRSSHGLSASEIDALLAAGRPMLLAVIGFGGAAVIAWLMMFKPF